MTNEVTKKTPKKSEEENLLDHLANILVNEFVKESDRACVIISAALLDKALLGILKAFLLPIGSDKDNLLEDVYAPLSTFSARIDIAHRLGLISTKFCRDLHIIRKIRNNFAHNISGCSFNETRTRDQIDELMRSFGIKKRNPKLISKLYSVKKGPRSDFFISILWMIYSLRKLLEKIEPLKQAELELGYTISDHDL